MAPPPLAGLEDLRHIINGVRGGENPSHAGHGKKREPAARFLRRPRIDFDWSKPPHRVLEDVQVKLRQHCNLQGEQRNAGCRDRQKPLCEPRNKICAVHVCILVD